jgi:hypothetical protein
MLRAVARHDRCSHRATLRRTKRASICGDNCGGEQTEIWSQFVTCGPGRTRTCNQTVMSGRITIGFVDFLAFSFEDDRVRCAPVSGIVEPPPLMMARRLDIAERGMKTLYIGLDVHKGSISVTTAEDGRGGRVHLQSGLMLRIPVGGRPPLEADWGAARAADRTRRCPPPWRVNRAGEPVPVRSGMGLKGLTFEFSALRQSIQ